MKNFSLWDKIAIALEVSKSSYIFIIFLLILIIVGFIFYNTNKKNRKRNKKIYLTIISIIIIFIILFYHSSLGKFFDYMMNNFFVAIYFPNLAIYFAAIIIMNIIIWFSIFNKRNNEKIKRINIIVYIIINYLLVLLLNIIDSYNLDIFNQNSIYGNEKARALIELSSVIYMIWIIFLIIYKCILKYLRRNEKTKVKKIVVKETVKKLPDNYQARSIPKVVYQKNNTNNKKELLNTIKLDDNLFTLDDYKTLQKLLLEIKEKEKQRKRREAAIREREKFNQIENLYRSVK